MRSPVLLVLSLLLACASAFAQSAPSYRGRTVQSVLDELRAGGAPLAYSTNLVPRRLLVESEPSATDPLDVARQILRPHGLALEQAGTAWLVVRGGAAPAAAAPGGIDLVVTAANPAAQVGEALAELDERGGATAAVEGGRAAFRDVEPGRHTLVVRAQGFVPQRASVVVTGGATAEIVVALVENLPPLEEVTVTASRYDLRSDQRPSSSYFSREQIENLSYLGDDALRLEHRLPGVATNDFSARSHVRGGAADETTVYLDGMKLIEPFHLRDYQAVFSAVDQRIISGIQIYSGGFPVQYGDALSGLTVMDRLEPTERVHTEIGLSALYSSLLSSGTFNDDREQWLVSVRRGNVDALLKDELGEPSYSDSFEHVGIALGEKHKLGVNHIGFDDDILVIPDNSPGNVERGRTDTRDNQVWATIDSDWSADLRSRTLLQSTHFRTARSGHVEDIDEIVGDADDGRTLDSAGLKQDWQWSASARHFASWGFEAEQADAEYAYTSAVDLRGVLSTLEPDPSRSSAATVVVHGDSYAAYLSDRWRITERLIADLGVRWDKQTYLPPGEQDQFSPRSSILYRLGSQTDLRVSYGRYFQPEGLLDLQIEDGVTQFGAAQNAAHSIVGIEHRFPNALALRGEVFRKWTHSARPRFENVFDPLEVLPELRPGRVEIAPEGAESRGVEVLLNAEQRIVEWWFGYAYSEADDVIDGAFVPRAWDQRHALNGGATLRVGSWTLSGVATLHSGWPTTTLTLVPSNAPNAVDGVIAVPGPRNAERLSESRRIDLRASRPFEIGLGSLRFFTEITNATDRANVCCVRYDPVETPGQPPALERVERKGLPLTLNIGALWEF